MLRLQLRERAATKSALVQPPAEAPARKDAAVLVHRVTEQDDQSPPRAWSYPRLPSRRLALEVTSEVPGPASVPVL